VIGHRDGGSGVENALEVGAGEVGDIHLAEHRTDETVAVSRLLLPVPLAPASTPGRAPTRVEVVLDESNTLRPTLCLRDSGRQALDDSCRLVDGLLPGGRRRVPTPTVFGPSNPPVSPRRRRGVGENAKFELEHLPAIGITRRGAGEGAHWPVACRARTRTPRGRYAGGWRPHRGAPELGAVAAGGQQAPRTIETYSESAPPFLAFLVEHRITTDVTWEHVERSRRLIVEFREVWQYISLFLPPWPGQLGQNQWYIFSDLRRYLPRQTGTGKIL
jgi:hypothetical protein